MAIVCAIKHGDDPTRDSDPNEVVNDRLHIKEIGNQHQLGRVQDRALEFAVLLQQLGDQQCAINRKAILRGYLPLTLPFFKLFCCVG